MLAQKTHAPDLLVAFEAGGLAPLLPTMPISVGDSRTSHRALMATSMCDIMDACQRGMIDYTFLGGAQIDAFGNLNSTVIGDTRRPKVRFPGSGGANDFASFCWRTLVITQHDRRRFVAKLDFLTTPGYLTGPGAREAAGLPAGTGPYKVITDLAVMGFHDADQADAGGEPAPGRLLGSGAREHRRLTCLRRRVGRNHPAHRAGVADPPRRG